MIEAVNSDQALELLASNSDVQLLFTDVTCREQSTAWRWPDRWRDRWPHIGIMVASAKRLPHPTDYRPAPGLNRSHTVPRR